MRYRFRFSAVAFTYLCCAAFLLFAARSAAGMPGELDSTFTASDARVLTGVGGSSDKARKVLVQPDGKLVVAGTGRLINAFGDFAVVRYNTDGSLDTSFDGDGKVVTTVGVQNSTLLGAALQPDGKIVAVGLARSSSNRSDDFAVVRLNSDGSLDTSFGIGGKLITEFSETSGSAAAAVAVQPDGKLVVAGFANNGFAVIRYLADGTPDQSFGANGRISATLGNRSNSARAVALQPDGKIVVAGSVSIETAPGNAVDYFGLARFNTNGTLDLSFDQDGKVLALVGDYNVGFDVELQSNGRIVVAGVAGFNASSSRADFALAGFNPDGSLDQSFGTNGKVITAIGNSEDRAFSLTVAADDKLLVAGETQRAFPAVFSESNTDFAIVRYEANGTLDAAFGANGKVITPVATNDIAYDAAIQSDGKIVVAGEASALAATPNIAVVRYQSTGALDQSFGYKISGSVATIVRGTIDEARAVTVQADGKIVSAGRARVTNRYYFAVVRQNSDGTLDTNFGENGTIITRIGTGDVDSEARAVAIQPDGKIVVAGRLYDANNVNLSMYYFALARYNVDGTLDQSFDGDGTIVVPAPHESNEAFAVAIDPNGKIVVAGFYDTLPGPQSNYDMAIVRLEPDGSLDRSFDDDGLTTVDVGGFDAAYALALQPDGKILIGGLGGTATDFTLVRYNANGTLDAEFGNNGKVLTPIGVSFDEIRSIALLNDHKIVAAGNARVGSQTDFAVARYNLNGTLDTTFDNDGKIITPIASNSVDNLSSVIAQANGKIIVVGTSTVGSSSNASSDVVLARYASTGALDATFGGDGIVNTDYAALGYSGETASAAALQADGKLIVAGSFRDRVAAGIAGDRRNFLLARYVVAIKTVFDFDGDGRTDISTFRPSNNVWYRLQSGSNNSFAADQFGLSGDKLAPADYDGDGRTDLAVFRPASGAWYLQRSSQGFATAEFGLAEDLPVPADYDGDGRADIAVFRPSSGVWYILRSRDNQVTTTQFGLAEDVPVVADYDADGTADIAVWRPSSGVWYLLRSRDGFAAAEWGISEDKPVVGDYDADGRSDLAVWRPSSGVWYLLKSRDGFAAGEFGLSGDVPTPGDYDGDGKSDLAVWRPSTSVWYLQQSSDGFSAAQFGLPADKPVPAAFVR